MKVDELTVAFSEDGREKVRELDKRVLKSSSSWATIAFLFAEIDADTGAPKPAKLGLRRFKKRGGRWVLDKHFVVASHAQARELAAALDAWFPAGAADVAGDDGDDDG